MATIMKNLTTETALSLFESYAIKQNEYSYLHVNSSKANYFFDKLHEIVNWMKENGHLDSLSNYYSHPNIAVRSWAACYLLPLHEKESLEVLEEIVKMKVPDSFDAQMTIREWKNGNLKNFYTL